MWVPFRSASFKRHSPRTILNSITPHVNFLRRVRSILSSWKSLRFSSTRYARTLSSRFVIPHLSGHCCGSDFVYYFELIIFCLVPSLSINHAQNNPLLLLLYLCACLSLSNVAELELSEKIRRNTTFCSFLHRYRLSSPSESSRRRRR